MPETWFRKVNGVRVRVRARAAGVNATPTWVTTESARAFSVSSACGRSTFLPLESPVPVQRNRITGEHTQDKVVTRSCHLIYSQSSTIHNVASVRKISTTSPVHHQSRSKAGRDEGATCTNPAPRNENSNTGQHRLLAMSSEAERNAPPDDSVAPPDGDLSIVFTDIVKSTAIWEATPLAMTTAMHTHDNMVRELISSNHGYEVKQNGDGFMIAFPSATTAVQFCLDVQERLLDESWPTAILKSNPGKETTDGDGHILFRGLKLRISAHWGRPVCNWNDVIHRMDYLGPMVNRAARFIEVTEGGQVVVSEDFLLQLQSELESAVEGEKKDDREDGSKAFEPREVNQKPDIKLDLDLLSSSKYQLRLTHQAFQLQLLGEHEFKGLSEPEKLYFIVPKSLEGRVDHWHQVLHVPGVKGNVRTTTKD